MANDLDDLDDLMGGTPQKSKKDTNFDDDEDDFFGGGFGSSKNDKV